MKTGCLTPYQDPSTVCAHAESADFCSLNGRTIRTDCRSDVDSRGGAGVCLMFG